MFEHFYRELLNFLARKVGDRDLAADLAQESYARVYAAYPAHAQPGSHNVPEPRALLYTTARHLVTDHYRRANVRGQVNADAPGSAEQEPPDPDAFMGPQAMEPDAILSGRQRLAAIEQAVSDLPPRPQEAFVLYKLDGLSRGEVAERMGVSVRTVEAHLEVAMQACMRRLQALDGGAPTAATTTTAADPPSRKNARLRE